MIKLLDQDLINKIAAGEVVERPASIVKELTENAVDAGATRIDIVIADGGMQMIQITDNGSGMSQEDAKLCLLRHATSKISDSEDLFQIQTLGFRGEALASIAAVSQFELVTKTTDSLEGYQVSLDASQQPILKTTAANAGAKVTVNNLFYNVPARQKFLKTAQTEFAHILRYLQQFALIHPELELSLTHNQKLNFHYKSSDWQSRVEQVLGKQFSSQLIPFEAEMERVHIEGFIAKPELVHGTHKNQYLFVNDRPVYDHLINRSILEAYDTLVPRGYFPAFVLKLQINPGLVDVNVHPRKSEVKFVHPGPIIQLLKSRVRQTLQENDLVAEKSLPSTPMYQLPKVQSRQPEASSSGYKQYFDKPRTGQVKQALEFSQQFSSSLREIKATPLEEQGWTVIGQIHQAFILVETPEGLQLMDQHAVSEITNYQQLITQRENGEIVSQRLLLPAEVELSPEEMQLVESNQQLFTHLGWEIDQLTNRSIQVAALPELLKAETIDKHFHEILDHLKEDKDLDLHQRELSIIKYQACRGAVMFGDSLTMSEMQGLLNQWLQVENNAACEHGRPASARISLAEMRKFFKR